MSNVKSNKSSFDGTSRNGDINEAILMAIQAAKTELRTDYVEYSLNAVKGKHGGFVIVNEITVQIDITSTEPTIQIL